MNISTLRQHVLEQHLSAVMDPHALPPHAFQSLDEAVDHVKAQSVRLEPVLLAALALADDLEARFSADALPETEASLRATLDQRTARAQQTAQARDAAREAATQARQAAQAFAAGLFDRRRAFAAKYGLTPEAAARVGWNSEELRDLFEPPPEDPAPPEVEDLAAQDPGEDLPPVA